MGRIIATVTSNIGDAEKVIVDFSQSLTSRGLDAGTIASYSVVVPANIENMKDSRSTNDVIAWLKSDVEVNEIVEFIITLPNPSGVGDDIKISSNVRFKTI